MEENKKYLIYLYCVTNNIPEIGSVENLVDKLFFINHRDIHAVVSKVPDEEFSEENLKKNIDDTEWLKDKVSIHEKIIEDVMTNSCVVPFKFATLFESVDSLKECIEELEDELKMNLMNFEGNEEWGVKIYSDTEKLKGLLAEEDGELLKMDKEIGSSSPGKAFFLKKKREELINTVLNKKIREYGQDSFDRLKEHSIQANINKLQPKIITERKEDMILNSVFLVDKKGVEEFMETVDVIKAIYNEKGLFFDCTGPWPPYNFCTFSNERQKNA